MTAVKNRFFGECPLLGRQRIDSRFSSGFRRPQIHQLQQKVDDEHLQRKQISIHQFCQKGIARKRDRRTAKRIDLRRHVIADWECRFGTVRRRLFQRKSQTKTAVVGRRRQLGITVPAERPHQRRLPRSSLMYPSVDFRGKRTLHQKREFIIRVGVFFGFPV